MRFRIKGIKGAESLEAALNELAKEIERVDKGRPRLNAGVNVLIDEGPEGFTITGTASGDGESIPDHPFTLSGSIVSGAAYISCTPGLIDNIVPTMGGTSLASVPAPKIAVAGADGQLWIKNTLDDTGSIIASIVEAGGAMPEDDEDGDFCYRLLGSFTSASGQFTSVWSALQTNQSHKRCGGVSIWGQA